jgi:hypothetical protein
MVGVISDVLFVPAIQDVHIGLERVGGVVSGEVIPFV